MHQKRLRLCLKLNLKNLRYPVKVEPPFDKLTSSQTLRGLVLVGDFDEERRAAFRSHCEENITAKNRCMVRYCISVYVNCCGSVYAKRFFRKTFIIGKPQNPGFLHLKLEQRNHCSTWPSQAKLSHKRSSTHFRAVFEKSPPWWERR